MPLFTSNKAVHGNVGIQKGRFPDANWKNRQVITTGYTGAGYANSVTWRNVNKLPHATEAAQDLGDILQAAANYTSGGHNRDIAFLWGTNGTGTDGNGSYVLTSCFSMRTDTTFNNAGTNLTNAVGDCATMMVADQWGSYHSAWINGGSAAFIQRFNLYTQTMAYATTATVLNQGGVGAGAHFSETFGYWWSDDSAQATPPASGKRKFVYSTETESTPTANIGWHSQQKGVSSKNGFGWAGNEGSYSGGNLFRKTQYSTETVVSSAVNKPVTNSGEENLDVGQDKQFMMGMYNGAQNNIAWRFTYATDSGAQGGTAMEPRGTQSGTGSSPGVAIPGRSSGHSWWRD